MIIYCKNIRKLRKFYNFYCYDNNRKEIDTNNKVIKACLKLDFSIINTYIDLIVKIVFVIFATNVSF